MTGFGAAEGPVAGGRVRVEIRTVNHRHFNPSLKLSHELSALEADLRGFKKKRVKRSSISLEFSIIYHRNSLSRAMVY